MKTVQVTIVKKDYHLILDKLLVVIFAVSTLDIHNFPYFILHASFNFSLIHLEHPTMYLPLHNTNHTMYISLEGT